MTETLINSTYEPCAQCGGLLDDAQRYCVFCGASRQHAADPVARYLEATGKRSVAAAAPVVVAGPAPRSDRWLMLALALLPVAAAAGVLVGRGSNGTDAVVAALRAQKAPVVQIGGAGAGTATTAAAGTGAGATQQAAAAAFPLANGFTVELRTLPAGADTTRVTAAARAKGAKDVGVLDPAGARVTPDPGGKLVLYSGAFHTRAQAEKALAKLAHDFPGARVVAVTRTSPSAAADTTTVAKHPTATQKAEGAKLVQQIQATKGKKYVDQQRQLPDTIVVP